MKQFLLRALSLATAVALFATGCEKNSGSDSNPTLNGTYTVSTTPLYGTATATDPDATALTFEDENGTTTLTFRQITGMLESLLPNVAIMDYEAQITFDNGAVTITTGSDNGSVTVFPQPESGLTSDMVAYTASKSDIYFVIDVAAIEALLFDKLSEEMQAQLNAALATLTQGALVYSSEEETLTVHLHYRLSGNTLSFYVDKPLLSETWVVLAPALESILPYLKAYDPTKVGMLEAIMPQINPLLAGLSSLEVGIRMTK